MVEGKGLDRHGRPIFQGHRARITVPDVQRLRLQGAVGVAHVQAAGVVNANLDLRGVHAAAVAHRQAAGRGVADFNGAGVGKDAAVDDEQPRFVRFGGVGGGQGQDIGRRIAKGCRGNMGEKRPCNGRFATIATKFCGERVERRGDYRDRINGQ